jgi:hypothetical protein
MEVEGYEQESAGETAQTSDFAWMSRELRTTTTTGTNNNFENTMADDSTLSGSFLTAALEEMRRSEKTTQNDRDQSSDLGDVTLSQQSTEEITNVSRRPEINETSFDTKYSKEDGNDTLIFSREEDNPLGVSFRAPLQEIRSVETHKMGPNEQRYCTKYKDFVANKILEFRRRHPNKLRVYGSMEPEEKEQAQQGVMKLIDRLGIATRTVGPDTDAVDDLSVSFDESIHGAQSKLSHQAATVEDNNASFGMCADATVDQSMALLSPQGESSAAFGNSPSMEVSMALLSPVHARQEPRPSTLNAGYSDSSTQSIEVARAARPFESPDAVYRQKKRLASTSGKRGADMVRARGSDRSSASLDTVDPDDIDSPLKMLETSIRRLSLAPDKMFTASQSPIPIYDKSPDDFPDISFGDEDLEMAPASPGSATDSLDDTKERRVRWSLDQECQELREVPGDTGLKSGATFHLKPFQTECVRKPHRKAPIQSFPDPLDFYEGRLGKSLARLFMWLRRRDESFARGGPACKGVILSLAERQIFDLVLKLLLDATPPDHQSQSQSSLDTEDSIQGKTLIVARTKEDLEAWARVLREGCSLSVLNHATLPVKQRKTQHSAKKCAKYDAILTTFDAMKSPDVTIGVDDNGYALTKKVDAEGGWFSSRNSSQSSAVQQCKQLSVLHLVNWRRIIFADILGQKCFLAKPETARAEAARSLNSESRYVFCILPCYQEHN